MYVATDELIGGAVGQGVYELLRQRLVRTVDVAAPGVGLDWSVPVPPGVVWEVLHARGTLTTSAVVANRAARLRLADGSAVARVLYGSGILETASLAFGYEWAAGIGSQFGTPGVMAPLPTVPVPVPAGWTVSSSTSGLDVGDQWSAVSLIVREWSPPAVQMNLDWFLEQLR